jgi:excisionase family DNA binding protein
MTLDELPDMATVPEVAALLRLSSNQVYLLVKRGDIPSVRLGGAIRCSKRALVAWMDAAPEPGLRVVGGGRRGRRG